MLKFSTQAGIYLDAQTVDRLCALANPDAVRLYLYAAAHRENDTLTAQALRLTPDALAAAERTLIAARLAAPAESEQPAEQTLSRKRQMQTEPRYTSAEVAALVTSDMAFAQIVREAESVLNPCLCESDLRELMTIYRYFGMPAECMILLLHFTAERSERQTGRKPSLATVKREALRWMENDIMTPEAAERFVSREYRLLETVECFEKTIGFQAYKPDEKRLLRSWAEMGFDEQAVAFAKEITIRRIGELQLKYAGSILKNWSEQHLTNIDAIAAYEAQREKNHEDARIAAEKRNAKKHPSAAQSASGSFSAAEMTALQEIQDYMTRNGGRNA